jgi:hypothetical protein
VLVIEATGAAAGDAAAIAPHLSKVVVANPKQVRMRTGLIKWLCGIDWMIFFNRERCLTISLRLMTCRRSAYIGSSGTQIAGRKPLA